MVTASMATIPTRVDNLPDVVDSLYNQVDKLLINLNGHDEIPECLKREKIEVFFHDNSMGDLVKFYNLQDVEGYIFTVDDDIIYPDDYVHDYIAKIEEYGRKYAVCVHGAVKEQGRLESYYGDTLRDDDGRKKRFHWCIPLEKDYFVDTGGTGCMAWHSDTLTVDYRQLVNMMGEVAFETGCNEYDFINMADIWFRWFCLKDGVDIVCMAHRGDYFKVFNYKDTIWSSFCYNERGQYFHDTFQTILWNFINNVE